MVTTMTEYERKKMTTCPDMCARYWEQNPYKPGVFICPGCVTWIGEDGRIYRQGNGLQEDGEKDAVN